MKNFCDCEQCTDLYQSGPEGKAFVEALWKLENGEDLDESEIPSSMIILRN